LSFFGKLIISGVPIGKAYDEYGTIHSQENGGERAGNGNQLEAVIHTVFEPQGTGVA
jgi:hypothetical protein